MALFPLGAAIVSAVFGLVLSRRFLDRRRPYEGAWAVALLMYAAASLAAADGVWDGWSSAEYRVYWLLGAVLNVVFLALGELYLLLRSGRAARAMSVVILAVSLFSVAVLSVAPVRAEALTTTLPLGREALGSASLAYQLRWLSWAGYLVLLGGTVWSVWRMRGQRELRERAAGTLWIALGATLVAIGSGVGAGFGIVPLFFASLAGGVAVMFFGFLRASGTRARLRPGAVARR